MRPKFIDVSSWPSLQQRGLQRVTFIVSDDHAGLSAARPAIFTTVPWQRCQFHLQQNAQAYVPRLELREKVAQDIRSVFNSPDRPAADSRLKKIAADYATTAPKLSAWLEKNLPQGLSVFALPAAHQRKLRTSNALERMNQKTNRRIRVARIFHNEASVLRLITAMLVEISEQWETGKIYLGMELVPQPSTSCSLLLQKRNCAALVITSDATSLRNRRTQSHRCCAKLLLAGFGFCDGNLWLPSLKRAASSVFTEVRYSRRPSSTRRKKSVVPDDKRGSSTRMRLTDEGNPVTSKSGREGWLSG